LSAYNTFFDSKNITDFCHSLILDDGVRFTNSIFGNGKVSFFECKFEKGTVDFSNTKFSKDDIDFQYTEFGKVDISFENAEFFGGHISFVNTHFGDGSVNFKNVYFGEGDLSFEFSTFAQGDISFERSVFTGRRVDFRKVEFGEGKIDFRRCDFGDAALTFEESELKLGKVNFRRTIFNNASVSFELAEFGTSEISFERSELGQTKFSFYNATFDTISYKSCRLSNYVDLRVNQCKVIDLRDTIIRDIVDLMPGDSNVRVDIIYFTGIRSLGRMFVDWRKNDLSKTIKRQEDSSLAQKAEQFRILKEEFRRSEMYEDEDKAYIEFKRMEMKAEKEKLLSINKWNAVWWYPNSWSRILIFDWMGLYATDPLRVLLSLVITYVLFSLSFVGIIEFMDADIVSAVGDPDKMGVWSRSFYHSGITFLTIGYGDFYPTKFIRWWSNVEGFVGVFMMSYFVVAFVRKILR